MNSVTKGYNALTGAELKKVIMAEIDRAIDNASINSPSITYPLCSWEWNLTVYQKVGESIERNIRAASAGVESAKSNPEMGVAESLKGGSKRFRNNPPSPSEVRKTEGLTQVGE